jgi:hypothetical protein
MALSRSELEALVETPVTTVIPTDTLVAALTSPPFYPTKVLINARDVGGLPGSALRPGFAYRTGTIEALHKYPEGLPPNVKAIFDLRSERERLSSPEPELPGVRTVLCAPSIEGTRPNLDLFVEGKGEAGLIKEYTDVLQLYEAAIRKVLEHVRDSPEQPFLFHCAGMLPF